MLELLYLKKKYDERNEKLEKFVSITDAAQKYGKIYPILIIIVAICFICLYVWIYSLAWNCFAKKKVPALPRIILCFVIMPVWIIFLILYYTDTLGCR